MESITYTLSKNHAFDILIILVNLIIQDNNYIKQRMKQRNG